jgi:uncharacterized secreted protein with C-terminal beta-propeller domain
MRNRITRIITLLTMLTLTAAACTADAATDTTRPRDGRPFITIEGPNRPTGVLASYSLVPFNECDSFLDYVISRAIDMVGAYGLDDHRFGPFPLGDATFFESAGEDGVARASAQEAPSYSETNVQVLGVDEPDMVKTDGERIVVLAEGRLIVADVTGDEPEVIGRLNLDDFAVQNFFMSGDQVLLLGSAWSNFYPLMEGDIAAERYPSFESPTVKLIQVDISGEPEIVRTMTIDGQYVSGRMVGDTVRLVLTSGPVGFEWSYPSGSGLNAERSAIEENKDIIRNSEPANWIPYFIVTDADGEVTAEGTLFDCNRAGHPEEFSGINMLSVATIDLSNGLIMKDATGVLASGETVYASADSLYVATQNWDVTRWAEEGLADEEPDQVTTDIHKFDISNPNRTDYLATGRVRGYLLNQFAMDEHQGLLRVASTTSPSWWGANPRSESLVTVLEHDRGALREVGSVDGLGKTEQIYSVRFMGDVAYVVTFRQTDPLYTVDLSDPTDPRVVGELKILGYSAYLHPVGDGLLLGVGQDASDTGQIKGTQVSLFDVSDPSDPVRVDTITLSEGSSSEVEYDHHAFLYWPETGLGVIPVQQWWWDSEKETAFFGAVGFGIDGDALDEIRRIAHPGGDDGWDHRAHIRRSIVIDGSLYTVSDSGIMKSDLDDLREEAWLGF